MSIFSGPGDVWLLKLINFSAFHCKSKLIKHYSVYSCRSISKERLFFFFLLPVTAATCVKGWSTWSPRSWSTETWQLGTSWSQTTAWPRSVTSAWRRWTPRCQTMSNCLSNGRPLKLWEKRSVWRTFLLFLLFPFWFLVLILTSSAHDLSPFWFLFLPPTVRLDILIGNNWSLWLFTDVMTVKWQDHWTTKTTSVAQNSLF